MGRSTLLLVCVCLAVAQGLKLKNVDDQVVKLPTDKSLSSYITNMHLMPRRAEDGKIHMWYADPAENTATQPAVASTVLAASPAVVQPLPAAQNMNEQVVKLPTDKSLSSYVKNMHLVPKRAEDGKIHMWYADPAENTATQPAVAATVLAASPPVVQPLPQPSSRQVGEEYDINPELFHSDLTEKPLSFGDWFHKVGASYDLRASEHAILDPQERGLYQRINSVNDMIRFSPDWGLAQSGVNPNKFVVLVSKPTSTDSHNIPQDFRAKEGSGVGLAKVSSSEGLREPLVFRSDVSDDILEPGRWYHKLQGDSDVSDLEYKQLPEFEQRKYQAITTEEQVALLFKEKGEVMSGTYSDEVSRLVAASDSGNIFRSDTSNAPLEFGKWYHEMGKEVDITASEYAMLSDSAKKQYMLVRSSSDLYTVTQDVKVSRAKQAISSAVGKSSDAAPAAAVALSAATEAPALTPPGGRKGFAAARAAEAEASQAIVAKMKEGVSQVKANRITMEGLKAKYPEKK